MKNYENELKLKLLKSKGGNIGYQTILYGIAPKLCHQEGKIIAAVGTPQHKKRFKQYGSPQYLDEIFQFYMIAHNMLIEQLISTEASLAAFCLAFVSIFLRCMFF